MGREDVLETESSLQIPIDDVEPDAIFLNNLPDNYNYNSGLPSSVPSSAAASIRSIPTSESSTLPRYATTPSTTNSAPPSYTSSDSPTPSRCTTPRPTPSTRSTYGHSLYSVAPSTMTSSTSPHCDACTESKQMVNTLYNRVQHLEESIGRILLNTHSPGIAAPTTTPANFLHSDDEQTRQHRRLNRTNCCTTFDLASPDLEAEIAGSATNCCTRFKRRKDRQVNGKLLGSFLEWKRREHRRKVAIFAFLASLFCFGAIIGLLIVQSNASRHAQSQWVEDGHND